MTSKLNMGRTVFVCILLITFSLLFTRDVEEFALEPLENMITTVKRISENPLQAILAIENENIIKSTIKDNGDDDDEDKKKTEPVILEKRGFRRFLADDVPMNTVAVIDLPPSVRATVDRRYLVVLTLVIGGAMILALARALNRR